MSSMVLCCGSISCAAVELSAVTVTVSIETNESLLDVYIVKNKSAVAKQML